MLSKAAWVATFAIGLIVGGGAVGQPVDTALIDMGSPNDWLTYHGSYKSYHFSPLDQINANNVRDLEVAWIHVPGRSTRFLGAPPAGCNRCRWQWMA